MAKGPNAFRTISEAADELGVPQHVLRFWETRFSFVSPMKRAGGRRFYRPQDILVLAGVRRLLHDEGYTIKGVQKLHKDQGIRILLLAGQGQGLDPAVIPETEPGRTGPMDSEARVRLTDALFDLLAARDRIDQLLMSPYREDGASQDADVR